MISKLFARYRHLLFEEYRMTPEALGLIRIAAMLVFLLLWGMPTFRALAGVSDYFFEPQTLSVARWLFPTKPPLAVFYLLDAGVLLSALCLLFGYRTRAAALVFTVLLITGFSLRFSLGKIGHSIYAVVFPLIMLGSGWENRYSIDARKGRIARPADYRGVFPFLTALLIGVGFFSAGVAKSAWLNPDKFGTYHYFIEGFVRGNKVGLLGNFAYDYLPAVAWKAMDYTTVAFEVLFLPAVLSRRIFRWFIAAAVCFHVVALLLMGIPYVNNYCAYLLFLAWGPVVAVLQRWGIPARLARWATMRNLGLSIAVWCLAYAAVYLIGGDILRDRNVSPVAIFAALVEWDYRALRGWIMVPGGLFVLLLDIYLRRAKNTAPQE